MTSAERHVLGQHAKHDDRTPQREEREAAIELREEQLAARKQQVESGAVSVGTEVVEKEQTLQVPVTREELTLERHAVDRRPSAEPIGARAEVLRVPTHEEQVEVDKHAVVYEEVNIGKRAVAETQRVSDVVRKEVLDVDVSGDVEVNGPADDRR